MTTYYPEAEWVPWAYNTGAGPTYFRGLNQPIAVVLHIAQGYSSTARQWAITGHYGASWHYTVCKDGRVLQHLEHQDGGYHAGIPQTAPDPTWALWKGHGVNVNHYTIGIEHEGFSGDGFTEAQAEASRKLCRWLAEEIGVPYDRDHFPPHADIDLINRPNDFGPPEYREAHYRYMFEEDDPMTPEERARLDAVYAALTGGIPSVIDDWNAKGNSLLLGYALEQGKLADHLVGHPEPGTHPPAPGTRFTVEVVE